MAKDNMIAKGVRMPQEMWDMCDTMTEKTSESSRNEFIRRAVEFYIEYKNHERNVEFLTPALESVIDGKIKDSEDRIARIIFKLAVDQNFLAHLIGNQYDYREEDLEEIRHDSMEEVRSTNGQISLTKAYRDGHRN